MRHWAWVFDDTWVYEATARSSVAVVGAGCAGSAGVPWAVPTGPAIVGNVDFALQVAPALPGSLVWMVFSVSPAQRPVSGGCVLYIEPTLLSMAGVTAASGVARVPVPLPAIATLGGLVFHGQGAVADPNGAWLGAAAFTQGLVIRVGD